MNKAVTMIILIILLFSMLIIFSTMGVCEETSENMHYVGGSGNGNYSSIQDAINASNIGDTIFVYHGTYNENIEVNKSINLIGENKEITIINGKNKPDIVTINASGVNISGFTIKDGLISGIWIESQGNCNIYQNNICNNIIGIHIITSSNVNIFNNTILNSSDIGIKISKVFPAYDEILCSENNTIYHNNLINNSKHAYDGCSNIWFYENEGNYWDDYNRTDKNNDGIGDISYEIPGGDNRDNFPLMMPYQGTIRLKEFYVDYGSLYAMLIIGMIVAVLFCLPIAYVWYRKYFKIK